LKKQLFVFFSLILIFGGCSCKKSSTPVADLLNYAQESRVYIENMQPKKELLALQRHYKKAYFTPWHMSEPPVAKFEAMWAFRRYKASESYGENLLPIDPSWFSTMAQQANFDSFGSVNRYAITRHFTHLRAFPTHKPLFSNPLKAGEGFPFDYMQNSGIHSNEPLFVSHYSKDGAWVYVFTSYASGWVRRHNITLLTQEATQSYEANKFLHVTHEHFPLHDSNGTFLTYARIGMMLPYHDMNGTHVTVSVYHEKSLVHSVIPRTSVHCGTMRLTRENMVLLLNQLIGRKYGWGGLYEERDCSSTLRDLFASFGIWLPRNSSKQANIGRVISLKGLNKHRKRERIIAEGVPFETILYRRGHVLLYLGVYKGKIMVFHDTWGVRTLNNGISGRKIIGKTVISTLDLGKEQPDYDPQYAHLKNLESMNIITQEPRTITP